MEHNQRFRRHFSDIDRSWTLFLDRDGTINKLLEDDYVRSAWQLELLPGVLEALKGLVEIFGRIVIVTNQQGIGKGLMTETELQEVHDALDRQIREAGGRIDAIYHCPALSVAGDPCRKPGIGMALAAQRDFPEIDFSRSVMVGDSPLDMVFGKNAGMLTVWIRDPQGPDLNRALADISVFGLSDFWRRCAFILNRSK